MGDIAFNIFKDVNLNKSVTLDINKDVFVNVENPDQLATAEADAEAFGPFALAEVDAYTVVTPPTIIPFPPIEVLNPGQVQLEGGTNPFAGTIPGENISIDFNQPVSPGVDGDIPDLDDLNAIDVLEPLDGIPPGNGTNDIGIPVPGSLEITDLLLSGGVFDSSPGANLELYMYTNENPFTIDFGERWIDRNLNGSEEAGERGDLLLSVPAGDTFMALFNTDTGAVEVDAEVSNATFSFTPLGGADIPENNAPFDVPAAFDLVADSLGSLGGYEIEALANFPWFEPGGNQFEDGTAFAYAESTSALDLSQMMGPMAM